MEDNFSSIVEYCDSCNLSFEPWNIRQYEVLYQGSKIHDQNKISLCNVCSKIAKYAEQFINNIQDNSLIKPEVQINKQPIKHLSIFNLGTLQLSDDDSCDTKTRYSIISAKHGEILTECGKMNVKMEDNLINSNDDELDGTNIKQEYLHEEDNTPHIQALISEEIDIKEETIIDRTISGSETDNSTQSDLFEESDETNIKQEYINEGDNTPHKDLISDEMEIKEETIIDMSRSETDNSTQSDLLEELRATNIKQEYFNEEDNMPLRCLINADIEEEKKRDRNTSGSDTDTSDLEEGNSNKEIQISIPKVHLSKEQFMQEREDKSKTMAYQRLPYKCADCVVGFLFKDVYLNHMKKHNKSAGNYECEFCKLRFKSIRKLHSHLSKHINRYKCTHCKVIRTEHAAILKHLYYVHKIGNAPKFECDLCDMVYNKQSSLSRHMSAKHSPGNNVICDYCKKRFKTLSLLRRHMTMKHPEGVTVKKKHVCQECRGVFGSPAALRRHQLTHSDRRDHYCVECDKGFKNAYALKAHLTISSFHVKKSDRPWACKHCPKRFTKKWHLLDHTNAIHLKIKPYQCDLCSMSYSIRNQLSRHKKSIHYE